MGNCNALSAIVTEVYVHTFAWVDAYLAYGCTTLDDTPYSMFWDGRESENFPRGDNKDNDMDNFIKLVKGGSSRDGG